MLSERTQERLIELVLSLLCKEVFQCETIEQVNDLGELISRLQDGHEDDICVTVALDLLAPKINGF